MVCNIFFLFPSFCSGQFLFIWSIDFLFYIRISLICFHIGWRRGANGNRCRVFRVLVGFCVYFLCTVHIECVRIPFNNSCGFGIDCASLHVSEFKSNNTLVFVVSKRTTRLGSKRDTFSSINNIQQFDIETANTVSILSIAQGCCYFLSTQCHVCECVFSVCMYTKQKTTNKIWYSIWWCVYVLYSLVIIDDTYIIINLFSF